MNDMGKTPEVSQAKSRFLANMSFELQSAIKNIFRLTDQIKQTNLSAKQNEYVDSIYVSTKKLTWVVNDILDFSQLESGKVELQEIDFNLEYLINDIFKKTVEQKKDHPVETYIDIAKDVPRDLVGDPTRLRQVLVNLLSNAFKYTTEGEIGIIVKKGGTATKANAVRLRISIKDTGKGIPKDKLDSIFELGCQGDPSRSWEFGGTGLGLTICKLIIEAMGGTIGVESKGGKGSTFSIDMDFGIGASVSQKDLKPLTKKELVGKKAIIIDDNEIARKVLKKCCDTLGIETVLISASPKTVLMMLEECAGDEEVPDLILCDIMMPEMDGYELMRRIRANDKYKNLRSIAVTSAVQVGSAKNAQESGFSGFLPKPVFLDELAKIITTVLGDTRERKTIVTRHMAEELRFSENKILVVEDKGSDRDLVEDCLKSLNCERDFVPSGGEAVESLKEKIYDLGIMDYEIIENEGTEIIRTMKEVSRNMPVVVLLDADKENGRSACLDAGVDDFIIKPVDMVNLKRIVKRYGKEA